MNTRIGGDPNFSYVKILGSLYLMTTVLDGKSS